MTDKSKNDALLKVLGDLDTDVLAVREQAVRGCIPRIEREIGAAYRDDDCKKADELALVACQLEDAADVLSRLYFAVVEG